MMKKIFQCLKSNPLPLLSGVLVGTSYIPFPPWAALFAYVPLWLSAYSIGRTKKNVFWSSWLTQFVLTLIGFHWIAETAHDFGHIPWPLSILALLIFAAIMHIYIPLAFVSAKAMQDKFRLSQTSTFWVAAILLSLFERAWPAIFQWHLGYVWYYAKMPIYQWADVIGFNGLSTLTLLFNAAVASSWIAWKENRKQITDHLALIGALFIFALLNLTGLQKATNWKNTDRQIKISLIQANIGNLEKEYAERGMGYQKQIIDRFNFLSNKEVFKTPATEVLVWPETAFPDYLGDEFLDRKHTKQLADNLIPLNKSLITGAYYKTVGSDGSGESTFNAMFLVQPNGKNWSPPYLKTHLLAFGEYLPLSERFPILLKIFPFISNFGRGDGPMVLSYPKNNETIKFGPQICYESLYSDFSRGLAEKGAQILVNVTNDSWFGKSFEPYQHMYMTLARAVEVRRPLVRSTNTGISTVVLATGEILTMSPIGQEWTYTYDVNFNSVGTQTHYTKWGHYDWIFWILILLVVILKGMSDAKSRNA